MLLPNHMHWVQRNSFSLRQEKYNKNGHRSNPTRIEKECPILEVAQHCQKNLGQHKRHCIVYGHTDALASWPKIERVYFSGYEPA